MVEEIKEVMRLEGLESAGHFWTVAKQDLVLAALKGEKVRTILEVGCGTGNLLLRLRRKGYDVCGMDLTNYVSKKRIPFIKADLEGYRVPARLRHRFDCVLALDVIEHVRNDTGALRTMGQMIKPGGLLIVNVPAHQSLYSSRDRMLGHKRRYSRSELLRKLSSSGYHVKRSFQWNAISLLPAYMIKILRRDYPNRAVSGSGALNRLLLSALRMERYVTFNRIGLSIFAKCVSPARRRR